MYDFLGFLRSRQKRIEERRQREADADAAAKRRVEIAQSTAFGNDVMRRYQERHRPYPTSSSRSADDGGWSNSPMNPMSPSGMILSPISPFSSSVSDCTFSPSSSDCSSSSSSSDSSSSSCSGGSD